MTLQEIVERLDLKPLTTPADYGAVTPLSGYASDLLSCVMAGAKRGGVWVTLQAHGNIVAVAALLELCAVVITEGAMPDQQAIAKANAEGVHLFSTPAPTFKVAGELWEMGLREG